jgi:Fe-S cluster assembly protein SufD
MAQFTLQKNPFLDGFEAFTAGRSESTAEQERRRRQFERFAHQGLPSRRHEDWLHTDLSGLAGIAFRPTTAPGTVAPADLTSVALAGMRTLVFVDGFYVPELSDLGVPLAGLTVEQTADTDTAIERENAFVALNGAYRPPTLRLAVTGTVAEPIQLLFVGTAGTEPTAAYPRLSVEVAEGGRATIVETHVGLGTGVRFICPLVDLHLAQNAALDHTRLVRESESAYHIANTVARLDRDAQLRSFALVAGGALVRHDFRVHLTSPGAEAELNGLTLVRGREHADHHLWVRHEAPHTASKQLYRGILAERARTVFNGNVFVAAAASGTDARQSNRNLLLSDEALVHTNPQLEIHAGDVRCTHGSTVGQLDADALFYLRARGLDRAEATALLTRAFATDLFDSIRVAPLREALEADLSAWLHGQHPKETRR